MQANLKFANAGKYCSYGEGAIVPHGPVNQNAKYENILF